jgi:hypothetical protein
MSEENYATRRAREMQRQQEEWTKPVNRPGEQLAMWLPVPEPMRPRPNAPESSTVRDWRDDVILEYRKALAIQLDICRLLEEKINGTSS